MTDAGHVDFGFDFIERERECKPANPRLWVAGLQLGWNSTDAKCNDASIAKRNGLGFLRWGISDGAGEV